MSNILVNKSSFQSCSFKLLIEFWILRIALRATALLFQMPNSHSNTAIDGIVKQHIGSDWQALAFFLKQPAPAYAKDSSYDREYLSAYAFRTCITTWKTYSNEVNRKKKESEGENSESDSFQQQRNKQGREQKQHLHNQTYLESST
uniref:Uncharacterized protein n=1 Tax=Glossina austeni TaxID=7395 RepID=A0A1A9UD53_GLOAU